MGGPQWLLGWPHLTNTWVKDAKQGRQSIQKHHLHPPWGEKFHRSYHHCVNNAHGTHKKKSQYLRTWKTDHKIYVIIYPKAPLPLRCFLEKQGWKQHMTNWLLPQHLGHECPGRGTSVASDCSNYKHQHKSSSSNQTSISACQVPVCHFLPAVLSGFEDKDHVILKLKWERIPIV